MTKYGYFKPKIITNALKHVIKIVVGYWLKLNSTRITQMLRRMPCLCQRQQLNGILKVITLKLSKTWGFEGGPTFGFEVVT